MVEDARLEIVWASNSLGGSNPLASAIVASPEGEPFLSFVNVRSISVVS